jgi:hypothetical protein
MKAVTSDSNHERVTNEYAPHLVSLQPLRLTLLCVEDINTPSCNFHLHKRERERERERERCTFIICWSYTYYSTNTHTHTDDGL